MDPRGPSSHAVSTALRQSGATNASVGVWAKVEAHGSPRPTPRSAEPRTPSPASSAGETIVLDFASNRFFTLDEVGGRIWELIAEKGTLQEILGSVVAEFDVDPERAGQLERLLSELAAKGLVRIDGDSG